MDLNLPDVVYDFRQVQYTSGDLVITRYPQRDRDDYRTWGFMVRNRKLDLQIVVEVSADIAFESKDARWWSERGNAEHARYDALKYGARMAADLGGDLIRRKAREMAQHA